MVAMYVCQPFSYVIEGDYNSFTIIAKSNASAIKMGVAYGWVVKGWLLHNFTVRANLIYIIMVAYTHYTVAFIN